MIRPAANQSQPLQEHRMAAKDTDDRKTDDQDADVSLDMS